MSEEPTPESTPPDNPRLAVLEDNLARAREKLTAAEARVDQLREQIVELEAAIDFEAAAADPPAEE
jgi:multidrug resistance efflux pump